jgi:phage terminase small subunit
MSKNDVPEGLSERSAALWRDLVPRRVASLQRQQLLVEGLRSLDRIEEARRVIAAEGLILRSARSGVAHAHPAVAIERQARVSFFRIWRELGLVVDPGLWEDL